MTITGPDARSAAPGQAVVDAAMLLLERMGLTPRGPAGCPGGKAARTALAGCLLARRPADCFEYGERVEVIPPVHNLPIAKREHGDVPVLVRVPGAGGSPL